MKRSALGRSSVLLYGITCAVLLTPLHAQEPDEKPSTLCTLAVYVDGVRSLDGGLEVELFDDPDAFPTEADQAVATHYVDLTDDHTMPVVFTDVPPGEYAVGVYHDEDGNRELNTNFLGIPKEGVGASQGAKGRMGPPKFHRAQFTLTEGKQHEIRIELDY